MYLTSSGLSITHSALNTGQHTVLFNQHQTMNLWGKELQVCHLCKVVMATPQQTLDRTRVFPINAFFPLLDEWESALCSRWPWRCHFWNLKNNMYIRHYSYPHAWCKQGPKSCADILRLAEGQDALRLSSMKIILHTVAQASEYLHVYSICLLLQHHIIVRGNGGRQIKLNF